MPAVKSRYFRFSTSHRYEPSPLTNTGGGRAYVATMKGACSRTRAALAESSAGSGFGSAASLRICALVTDPMLDVGTDTAWE